MLGGRYEVGELIGRGGMAEVHLGHDNRLGRTVAIKVLRTDLARDNAFLTRFRREAHSAAGLNHHAIVSVYDSGEDIFIEAGGGRVQIPYIVMEYVDGRTLREILNEEGHLSPDEAARVTMGILSALEYSHEKGIVHRDIKPGNVMLTRGGSVKVMDFGIARAIADSGATMTGAQAVVGTARYLSPEQAQGESVDARSDLYSAGCVLYELLTGRTPFIGEPVSLVYQHITDKPQPPSVYEQNVPAAMDAVTLHSLEKGRDARYQTAEDFRADLQNARAGRPVSEAAQQTLQAAGVPRAVAERPDSIDRRDNTKDLQTAPPRKRRMWLWAVAVLAALVAIGGVGLLINQQTRDKTAIVPPLNGMTQSAAEAALTAKGFQPAVVDAADNAAKGIVIGQDPKSGAEANVGSVVTITVSAGPGNKVIPANLAGMSYADATAALSAAGFQNVKQGTQQVDDTQWAQGLVASTSPAAGTTIPATQTVYLNLSSGQVTVPANLVNMTASDASAALLKAHLFMNLKLTPVGSQNLVGTVRKVQDSGEKVAVNSSIDVYVGTYTPPNSTITVSPTSPPTTPTSPSTSTAPTTTTSSAAPTTTTTPPATTTTTTSPPAP
ncbi:serine/threonine protein kinase [Branchiibius sp. NY16-3462-2]|nr:serine/threonine protein kinase [Branchiibius sp. NY16-3462-2]